MSNYYLNSSTSNINKLISAMRSNNETQQSFSFDFRKLSIEAIIDIGTEPWQVLLGIRDLNLSFVLEIQKGYFVNDLDQTLLANWLLSILQYTGNSNVNIASIFLAKLRKSFPTFHINNIPTISRRILYSSDVEEKDKIYFLRWNPHNGKNNGNVTPKNLNKTLKILGLNAYSYCKEYNISSCWNNKPEKDRYLNKEFYDEMKLIK